MKSLITAFAFLCVFISPLAQAGGLDTGVYCRDGEWEIFISPSYRPQSRSVSISFSHPTKTHEELDFDDASSLIDSNGDRALFGQKLGKGRYSLWGANADAKYRSFYFWDGKITINTSDCSL